MNLWKARFQFCASLAIVLLVVGQIVYLGHLPHYFYRFRWWEHPWDRILHFVAYGSATALALSGVAAALREGSLRQRRWLVATPVMMIAIGCADEIAQIWQAPWRRADVGDALADAAGVLTFTLGFLIWRQRSAKRQQAARANPFPQPMTVAGATGLMARICQPWIQASLGLPVERDAAVSARLERREVTEVAQLLQWSLLPGLGLEALARWWPKDSEPHNQLRALFRTEVLGLHSTNLRQDQAIAKLLQALHAAGVAVAPYKGSHLAHLIGQPAGLRPSGDLDLLIRSSDFPGALRTFEGLGCRQITDDPVVLQYMATQTHDYHLKHPEIGDIELHIRPYADLAPDAFERIWSRARLSEYLGAPVWVLDPSDLYVLLCVHLFMHGWTSGAKWVIDLLYFSSVLEAATGATPAAPASGHYLSGLNVAAIAEVSREFGAAFPVLAVQAQLAHFCGRAWPSAASAALRSQLNCRELEALAWLEAPTGLDCSVDWLVLQARRARQAGRERPLPREAEEGGAGFLNALWPHPGRIAMEMHVRSDAPHFWWMRVGWAVQRLKRIALAMLGAPSPTRVSPQGSIGPWPETK